MEDLLENWISELEMEEYDVLNESEGFNEQEFLREILESSSPTNSTVSFDESISLSGTSNVSNSNSNSIKSPSPATYLLSFDNSTAEPLMPQPRKKLRRSSETQHHIIAERKRRQELTGSIIALSATIPGLKKMDKAHVLREAVNYTKQLQERVKELENQNKYERVDSSTLIRKSQASSKKSSEKCETKKESVFEVEARVLDEEVLIGIHCEKQKEIVLKIHALLQKLHLSATSSSVLPFGTSTLIINIIARMDEEYSMSTDELVKKLREYLLEMYGIK